MFAHSLSRGDWYQCSPILVERLAANTQRGRAYAVAAEPDTSAQVSNHELLVAIDTLGQRQDVSQRFQVSASIDALFWPFGEALLEDVHVPGLTPCDRVPCAKVHVSDRRRPVMAGG